MTTAPRLQRPLPLVGALGTGSRATCTYQCGDACDRAAPNTSDNPTFADVVAATLHRRGFLKAGLSASVVLGAHSVLGAAPALAEAAAGDVGGGDAAALTFCPIEPTTLDDVVVPRGYGYQVLIRCGDPILAGAPAFDFERQTPQAQAGQFGYNCDYVAFLPFRAERYSEEPQQERRRFSSWHGLLVVNHEYTNPELMFRDYRPPLDPDDPESAIEDPTR